MAGKRKLFLTHAGELAHRLVRGLFPDAKAAEFIRAYADRHNRKKLVANPERLRMLEASIGRESLLVAAVELRRLFPRRFAGNGKARRSPESELAGRFEAEFLASLERSLDWPAEDAAEEAEAFHRDLEIYQRWTQRPAPSAAGSAALGQSPFADRCAILLDPAMMEQARRSATLFEGEILRGAARALANLGERAPVRASKKAPNRRRVGRGSSRRGKR